MSIGDTLNLTCQAYDCDINSFVFEWYLNGVELPMSVVLVQELALSHITVEIRSESDLGDYTCNLPTHDSSASVMVNSLGMLIQRIILIIQYYIYSYIYFHMHAYTYDHMYMCPEVQD